MNSPLTARILAKLEHDWSTAHYGIEYEGYLFNHLAHGVISLSRLGASEKRIERFVEWYAERLEKRDEEEKEASSDLSFDDFPIGTRDQYYLSLPFYQGEVSKHGIKHAISTYQPRLLQGISGAAFHGLIHLGYGYAAASDRLVSEGLAYQHSTSLSLSRPYNEWVKDWASRDSDAAIDFPTFRTALVNCFTDPSSVSALQEAILENIANVPLALSGFQRSLITVSRYAVSILDSITSRCNHLFSAADSSWFIDLAMEVFASTVVPPPSPPLYTFSHPPPFSPSVPPNPSIDFFLLHGVTSAWALSEISPLLSPPFRAYAHYCFVNALFAAYVTQGHPALSPSPLCESPPKWEEIVEEVVGMDVDEHKYKLVQIAWERGKRIDGEGEGGRERVGMLCEDVYKDAALKATRLPFRF